MTVGYKPPKFVMFDGIGDPHAYLREYCDKLVGVGRNEKLRMKLFIRSLSGETLTWYTRQDPRKWRDWQEMAKDFMTRFRFNIEITANIFSLANIQKKPSENFQQYARRWKIETARVHPPLDKSELSKYFIRAQEGIYFDKMMSMMGQKFVELVKMGDFIEESVKSGKIQSMVALQAESRAIQSGSIGGIKKKRRQYDPVQAPIHQNGPTYAPRPYPNPEARNARTYTSIAEPYAQLFERLRKAGVLQPVEGKLPNPIPRNFDGNKRCTYHSGIQGHDTKDCYSLKNQIESLIIIGVIKYTSAPPNVNNNPLPNHENWEVNMVTLDDEYGTPDYLNIDEANVMTSLAQPVITVQLREPLNV
ncbi:hypothetical protein H5410_005715 [Solanum commersonii]|uniref:Retrotransposon gag domain-containing protein n=1 Tax=Solanum commersonii TaxID=4109 RepID=A0A9J6A7J9_SOLCO|nr:hypothetical protein H5410_005715 [Solanum commersonii]